MPDLLLLNGPNLGILGVREPQIYGRDTLADIEEAVAKDVAERGWRIVSRQHDGEGEMVRTVQNSYDTVGAIVNPEAN